MSFSSARAFKRSTQTHFQTMNHGASNHNNRASCRIASDGLTDDQEKGNTDGFLEEVKNLLKPGPYDIPNLLVKSEKSRWSGGVVPVPMAEPVSEKGEGG